MEPNEEQAVEAGELVKALNDAGWLVLKIEADELRTSKGGKPRFKLEVIKMEREDAERVEREARLI